MTADDTAVEEPAPAKINLTLHVTGRRADGYHLLDSLVVFADVGDVVRVRRADAVSLSVTGPMAAGVPTGAENSVLRAAALIGVKAAITLDKHLPSAAGIGGGSSDAAAALRALARLGGVAVPEALSLGADVPVCLRAQAARMREIGADVEPVGDLPVLDAVLVNPGVPVATPEVFARLTRRDNPAMPKRLPRGRAKADFVRWLAAQRNDLEVPARAICPQIGDVLDRLGASKGCALARMSGSGATCFGIFPDSGAARRAAARIEAERPDWWVTPTRLR